MKDHIRAYFDCWLTKDASKLSELFAENVVYTESYGPEYCGISQILRWFTAWIQVGTVLKWDIKQLIEQDTRCAVEWYFQCEYDHEISAFDGVSIITFDEQKRITSVKEFQSKAEHIYPYAT